MLVIRRKIGESVRLNRTIQIIILDIENGKRVKIGVDAPPEVVIMREELLTPHAAECPCAVCQGEKK